MKLHIKMINKYLSALMSNNHNLKSVLAFSWFLWSIFSHGQGYISGFDFFCGVSGDLMVFLAIYHANSEWHHRKVGGLNVFLWGLQEHSWTIHRTKCFCTDRCPQLYINTSLDLYLWLWHKLTNFNVFLNVLKSKLYTPILKTWIFNVRF